MKPQPYRGVPILEQTLYLYPSSIFMHALLLVFSAILLHLFPEAHLNPTFPLFSLPLMKETLPGRILNSLLPLDIGCFHVYLILGYYLPNSIPLLIWNSQKGSGSVLLGPVSHIKPHSVSIRQPTWLNKWNGHPVHKGVRLCQRKWPLRHLPAGLYELPKARGKEDVSVSIIATRNLSGVACLLSGGLQGLPSMLLLQYTRGFIPVWCFGALLDRF